MNDCDFIPRHYHETRCFKLAVRRRASMLSCLLAMMLIWIVSHQRDLSAASAMLAEAENQREQMTILAQRKGTMEEQQARLTKNNELLTDLATPTEIAIVLADLSSRVRDPIVLSRVSFHAPCIAQYAKRSDAEILGATTPSTSGAGSKLPLVDANPSSQAPQILLTGIARTPQDVISLAAALENSPLFDRIQIVSETPGKWAGRRAEKFELTCDLIPHRRSRP